MNLNMKHKLSEFRESIIFKYHCFIKLNFIVIANFYTNVLMKYRDFSVI